MPNMPKTSLQLTLTPKETAQVIAFFDDYALTYCKHRPAKVRHLLRSTYDKLIKSTQRIGDEY